MIDIATVYLYLYMSDLQDLLNELADQEEKLGNQEFLAPCVSGGKVQTTIAKMVYTFTPHPTDFEGWGIFLSRDSKVAEVIDEPTLPQISEYLRLFPPLRVHLAYPLQGQTWLGYPLNESDMQQRFGPAKPVVVHLVSEGRPFERAIARFDGGQYWFEEIDRRGDLQQVEQLREALQAETTPEEVQLAGLTPEMRMMYGLAWQQTPTGQAVLRQSIPRPQPRNRRSLNDPQNRLHRALAEGGGQLRDFSDRGDYWLVEWTTADGQSHTSAIQKADLTVMSSGICLSGRDRDFDLHSLVGVIHQWDEDDYY